MALSNFVVKQLWVLGFLLLQSLGFFFTSGALPPSRKRRSSDNRATPWSSFKKLLTCKSGTREVHSPQDETRPSTRRCYNIGCTPSLHVLKDIIQGNGKVLNRPEATSPEHPSGSSSQEIVVSDPSRMPLSSNAISLLSPKPPVMMNESQGFVRNVPLKKLGCHESHGLVYPLEAMPRDVSLRPAISVCHICGEIFNKSEAFEQHQTSKHAVSELTLGDSARNIVDIIFQTSWLKSEATYNIEKILKIHNSQKTIDKFEDYRDMIKAKANKSIKKNPRCLADGNELLRFHCTTFTCSLGANTLTSLCNSSSCHLCNIIRNGFSSDFENRKGIYTTSSSGKAHDSIEITDRDTLKVKRAMLLCRVIAGQVNSFCDSEDILNVGFDSMAGQSDVSNSNLDELFVFDPKAVLPCFIVMYMT